MTRKLDEYIDHMVEALQRDHETNAVTWARLAETEMLREALFSDNEDELIGDYWEGYFDGEE